MRARTRLAVTVAGGGLLTVLAACGGASSGGTPPAGGPTAAGLVQHPSQLIGKVGLDDAYTISLTDENGKAITNLAAGSYSLTVHDYSGIHNFHLAGQGVNDATQVGSTSTQTYHVTFSPGTYTFQCDPHASSMHGSFRVS